MQMEIFHKCVKVRYIKGYVFIGIWEFGEAIMAPPLQQSEGTVSGYAVHE